MRGNVVIINRKTGLFAVRLEDGDFAVLELLDGGQLETNVVLVGELDALGGEEVNNETQDGQLSVFGQTGRCSLEAARRLVYAHRCTKWLVPAATLSPNQLIERTTSGVLRTPTVAAHRQR